MTSRRPLFEVRPSPIQGHGVFAVRRIRKGTRIVEYAGERISAEEADRLYDDSRAERTHTFLFILDDDTVIDAARSGNEARYINHSCDPNCESVLEGDRVFIEAIRTIQPGAELAYDYRLQCSDATWDELKQRYPCHCGAPKCRGTLVAPTRSRSRARRSA
jgi:hypothetical protein